MIELQECKRLSARITQLQCNRNRTRIPSCLGCPGLGELAQVPQINCEVKKMSKHRCGKKNCTRAVKNEGDMCWQHKGLEDQIDAGTVEKVPHPSDLPITLEDIERASDEFQETIIQREVADDHYPALPESLEEEELAQVYENAHVDAGWEPLATEKPTGLAALLRLPPPPPEPQSPDGLLIPFTKDEVISLIESAVTLEHIRKFVLMGLEGKVVLADDTDPLAKSRVHAAA